MLEKIFTTVFKELNKHNITGSCFSASYLIIQCAPKSEVVKGFLFRGKFYCLKAASKLLKENTQKLAIIFSEMTR